jgi:starvation-inducible DNA-binding protein
MKVDIGITEKNRNEVAAILNKILANEYALYTKTLNFHWNVEGCDFHALHLFFEKQYEELLDIVDDVAERVRSVGCKTIASLKEFAKLSSVEDELFGGGKNQMQMVEQLAVDHETIIKLIRKDADVVLNKHDDIGTNNFLIDLLEDHEKMAWMLRAFLPKNPLKKY